MPVMPADYCFLNFAIIHIPDNTLPSSHSQYTHPLPVESSVGSFNTFPIVSTQFLLAIVAFFLSPSVMVTEYMSPKNDVRYLYVFISGYLPRSVVNSDAKLKNLFNSTKFLYIFFIHNVIFLDFPL